MKTMPLPEIKSTLRSLTDCPEELVDRFLAEFEDIITDILMTDGSVAVAGIGTFRRIESPSGATVEFAPASELSEAVNAPFAMFDPIELDDEVTGEMLDDIAAHDDVIVEDDGSITFEHHIDAVADGEEHPLAETSDHKVEQNDSVGNDADERVPSPVAPPQEAEPATLIPPAEDTPAEDTPAEDTSATDMHDSDDTPIGPDETPGPDSEPATETQTETEAEAEAETVPETEPDVEPYPEPLVDFTGQQNHVDDNSGYDNHHLAADTPTRRSDSQRGSHTHQIILASLLSLIVGLFIGYFAYSKINFHGVKSVSISADDVQIYQRSPENRSEEAEPVSPSLAPDSTKMADKMDSVERQPQVPATEPAAANALNQTHPSASDAKKIVTDTVKSNRFLTTMAQEHYGKKKFWVYIYKEKESHLDNPDKIAPRTIVVIPPAEKYGIRPGDKTSEAKAEMLASEILAKYSGN